MLSSGFAKPPISPDSVKNRASGAQLLWSTFLGGTSDDAGNGVVLDSAWDIAVTGSTRSTDFPTMAGAYDQSYNGGGDVHLAKLNVGASVAVDDPATSPGSGDLHLLAPNPIWPGAANRIVEIRYGVRSPAAVRLSILDVTGRTVQVLADRQEGAGVRTVPWDTSGLASGVYFCRLTLDGVAQSRKIVVLSPGAGPR